MAMRHYLCVCGFPYPHSLSISTTYTNRMKSVQRRHNQYRCRKMCHISLKMRASHCQTDLNDTLFPKDITTHFRNVSADTNEYAIHTHSLSLSLCVSQSLFLVMHPFSRQTLRHLKTCLWQHML